MGEYKVVHISDLHFGLLEKHATCELRVSLLIKLKEILPDLLIINGDVFDFSIIDELCNNHNIYTYNADQFFARLERFIAPKNIFFCYGNHETQNCLLNEDHHKEKYNYPNSINYTKLNQSQIFNSYQFTKNYFLTRGINVLENNFTILDNNNLKIKLQNFHTSWLVGANLYNKKFYINKRKEKEDYENANTFRRLVFYENLPDTRVEEESYDLRIIIMHHNSEYLRPQERLKLNSLANNKDIILQAHSHQNYPTDWESIEEKLPIIVQAGALNFNNDHQIKAFFNTIDINKNEKSINIRFKDVSFDREYLETTQTPNKDISIKI